jgi:hypothetical protein
VAALSGLEYIEIIGLGWPQVQAEQPGATNSYNSIHWVSGAPYPTQAELDAWLPATLTIAQQTTVGGNGTSGIDMGSERIIYGVVPYMTATSVTPADKTTPLITEGTQIMTVTVVPSSLTSKLVVDLNLMVGCASSKTITAALFRDGVCIAVAPNYIATSAWPVQLVMHYVDTPKTNNAVTYTIRVGVNISAIWYIANAGTGTTAVTYNNVPTSSWSITEF